MADELPPIIRTIQDDDNPDRTEELWPALVLPSDGCSYDDDWQRMTLPDLIALVAALPDEQKATVYEAMVGKDAGFVVGCMERWAAKKTQDAADRIAELESRITEEQKLTAVTAEWHMREKALADGLREQLASERRAHEETKRELEALATAARTVTRWEEGRTTTWFPELRDALAAYDAARSSESPGGSGDG